MEVNYFAHVRVTKRLLPLLMKSQGRVVNVTSAAGSSSLLLAVSLSCSNFLVFIGLAGTISSPCLSAYSASKYALEAFSDALRREMNGWGMNVSIIAPGFMKVGEYVLMGCWRRVCVCVVAVCQGFPASYICKCFLYCRRL